MKIIDMDWEEYNQLAYNIYEEIKDQKFDEIIAITRSGLVLGVHLAHLLEIREFGCIDVKRTESDEINAEKSAPKINYRANMDNLEGKHILIVDDIIGAGDTMKVVKEECIRLGATIKTCVLTVNLDNYHGEDIHQLVDYVGAYKRGWIIFPWCKREAELA